MESFYCSHSLSLYILIITLLATCVPISVSECASHKCTHHYSIGMWVARTFYEPRLDYVISWSKRQHTQCWIRYVNTWKNHFYQLRIYSTIVMNLFINLYIYISWHLRASNGIFQKKCLCITAQHIEPITMTHGEKKKKIEETWTSNWKSCAGSWLVDVIRNAIPKRFALLISRQQFFARFKFNSTVELPLRLLFSR